MTDQILEIIQRNYDKFTGTNEAELHAAEEIAAIVGYWQQRCKLAEKYLAAIPIHHRQWYNTSAEHHKQMYHDFIRDNPEPK